MKKYNNYILEKYVGKEYARSLDAKDLDNYLSKYCPDFSWNDTPIYRGVKLMSNEVNHNDVMLFNPKAIERKSANTNNFYTWIVDDLDSWKDYPKRSKSLICSNSTSTRAYGPLYRVIPFKNANRFKINFSSY